MTILFGGGEMGAFIPSDSGVVEVTNSNYFDPNFARCALQPTGSAGYAEGGEFTETADLWIHLENMNYGATNSATLTAVLTMLDGAGTEVFQIQASSPLGGQTQTWQLKYWNGSAWTALGSSFTVTNALQTLDIHIVANSASGSGTVYVAGTQRSTGTADLSSIAGVAQLKPNGKTTTISSPCAISQPVVSTESTIGYRLKTVPATAAGATTDWTGGYTEIDEIVYADTDFINSATANQVELFAHSVTVPTGYRVKAVIVTARAKKNTGSGPQNIQLALRSGGTTYFSASQALGFGYGAHVAVWENDPATAAAFTSSAIAALQFGVKSIA